MPSSDKSYPHEEKHPHNKLTSDQQTLAGGELFFRKPNFGEAAVVVGDTLFGSSPPAEHTLAGKNRQLSNFI